MLTHSRRLALVAPLGLGLLAGGALGGAAAAAAPAAVQIKGYAYGPAQLTINAGDTVTWTNADTAGHDVTSIGGTGPMKSSLLGQGQTYAVTFPTAGTFRYTCTVHPDMVGTVTVKAAATTSTSPTSTSPTTSAVGVGATTVAPATTVAAGAGAPPGGPTGVAAAIGPRGASAVAVSTDGGRTGVNPLLFVAAVVVAVVVGTTIVVLEPTRRREGGEP